MNNRKGQFDNLQFCKDIHILTGAMQELGTWFQSTHPYGVRHIFLVVYVHGGLVSIHAPVWGATFVAYFGVEADSVSIHAPAWGATQEGEWPRCASRCFNPRTRMGCDMKGKVIHALVVVSIHAPAWGATTGG